MSEIKINALVNISTTHMTAMRERMGHEWRVIFTSIGLYVSVIALDINRALAISAWAVWLGCVAVALISSGYLLFLHHSDLINKRLYIHAETELISVARNPWHDVTKQPDLPKLSEVFCDREGVAWLWQSSAILAFSIICAFVVTQFNN